MATSEKEVRNSIELQHFLQEKRNAYIIILLLKVYSKSLREKVSSLRALIY